MNRLNRLFFSLSVVGQRTAMTNHLSFLWKDYRILKFCFMVLTSYLFMVELQVFLINKPTLTSVSQKDISPEIFPDILICPDQGFEIDELNRLGYQYSFFYSLGLSSDNIGWLGSFNQTNYRSNETQKTTTQLVHKLFKQLLCSAAIEVSSIVGSFFFFPVCIL